MVMLMLGEWEEPGWDAGLREVTEANLLCIQLLA